ncbi:protein required for normal CLN1 and CLN2 G1 cyclin expression [Pleosporales sp. CAS-2024a]
MSAVYANGANGVHGAASMFPPPRYSDVPNAITISVADEEGGQLDVEVPLDEDIQDDPTELCAILENEKSLASTWVQVAVAYAKQKKVDVAIDVLKQAIDVFGRARAEERLSILNGLCWLYLLKCREAPRVKSDDPSIKTKDVYIQEATGVLNEASRISPSHPPLFLARGVLYLLRASLQAPATAPGPNAVSAERAETLKQAAKCFDDALRASGGRNLMAKMGRARVSYSMGKWAEALKGYQGVLEASPDMVDPDPRIGIGNCFWQLGFKDDAAGAWQRSLDLNPKSKIANILLAQYNLHLSAQHPTQHPEFVKFYKKAVDNIMASLQLDKNYPLTCSVLGGHFIMRKQWDKAQTVARRAIDLTDVNAVASDGWYHLARKAHTEGDIAEALTCYGRSDQARGGDERGFVPAKFGSAQMSVLQHNYDGAKFRLEKIIQQSPNIEAQTLLGTLYAEDVFTAQNSKSTEDKSAELRKATKHLEDVQKAWRDPKKKATPDQSVLLNLARLYETNHPEKSLKCLEEVEQMELDAIPQEDYPEDIEEEYEIKAALRELLPPQLLNNMACFHFQAERYVRARELFQAALNACVKAATRDESIDTDALVTSISYNLGRCYEAENMLDEAKDVYENLLKRHTDYIDARIRLAYIALHQSPNDLGPRAVKDLFTDNEDNVEVRALYGWYLNRSKRRTQNIATDDEQRLYKHTLQKFDKHDQYSLTGMGNIHMTTAREMPRSSEQEKARRQKSYETGIAFFDKVLQLDKTNAYAAQGIAIALVEDKKDYGTALQIFNKVKETIKDHSVYVNLGHTYCEIKQYARAIENYEAALAKGRSNDPKILACLGRAWYQRARHDRNIDSFRTALDYSKQALKIAPSDLAFQFNVAFIHFQIAQTINNVPEAQRTLQQVDDAIAGLMEAIESLDRIAKAETPPFPRNDITSRANMGRNTMVKQLERAREKQVVYEEENKGKLEQARKLREEEIRRREEAKQKEEQAIQDRRRKIIEEQERIAVRDRELMEKRADEDRRRMEEDEDRELRKAERKARGPKQPKRKKKDADSDTEGLGSDSEAEPRSRRRRTTASGTEGLSDEERPREKKKRKLARKSEPSGKYKSAEFVDDDSDGDAEAAADTEKAEAQLASEDEDVAAAPRARKGRVVDDEDEDDEAGIAAPKANGDVAMDQDEDEDE